MNNSISFRRTVLYARKHYVENARYYGYGLLAILILLSVFAWFYGSWRSDPGEFRVTACFTMLGFMYYVTRLSCRNLYKRLPMVRSYTLPVTAREIPLHLVQHNGYRHPAFQPRLVACHSRGRHPRRQHHPNHDLSYMADDLHGAGRAAAGLLLGQGIPDENIPAARRSFHPILHHLLLGTDAIRRIIRPHSLFRIHCQHTLRHRKALFSAPEATPGIRRLHDDLRILDSRKLGEPDISSSGKKLSNNPAMQFNDNQPIWLQIYDHACRAIVSGRWPERERIPSIRELAVTLQVNPNTVMRAYDKLGSDGLILIRRGMGFFVAEGSQARTLEAQRHEFIRVELHTMFARMDELGIDMNDLQTLHNNYLKRKSHELY